MSERLDNENAKGVRLWCIAAAEQPVVCVLARCFGDKRWTCVLRWHWRSGKIEEGAWTTLDLIARHCRLSPNGEFLLYHGRGPIEGPFSAYFGGAQAISRLPWLAALTDIRPWGPVGESESVHGLKPRSQERLWELFARETPTNLLEPLDRGWEHVDVENLALPGVTPRHAFGWARIAAVPSTELSLIAVADCPSADDWSVWRDDLRFFVARGDGVGRRVLELPGVRWAAPVAKETVLVATADASVGVMTFTRRSSLDVSPSIEKQISLADLTPNPGPAPSWAMAEVWK